MKRATLAVAIGIWCVLPTTWWWKMHCWLREEITNTDRLGVDKVDGALLAMVIALEGALSAIILSVARGAALRNDFVSEWEYSAMVWVLAVVPHWLLLMHAAIWPVLTARADQMIDVWEKQEAQAGDISLIGENE